MLTFIGMIFLGVPQNIYHFMEVLHTMTTIIMLVEEVNATMPQYLPIVITFMKQIRYVQLMNVTIIILILLILISKDAAIQELIAMQKDINFIKENNISQSVNMPE
jgi:hypothetical protein